MQGNDLDLSLAKRVLAGDTEAFAKLVDRHRNLVLGQLYLGCGDRAWAEELAQDVFLRAWRSLGTWVSGDDGRPRAKLATWLCAIARNVLFDARRTERRQRGGARDDLPEAPKRGQVVDPYDQLERAEQEERVRAAVSKLPMKYQAILVCVYFGHKTLEQTAQELGVPIGTAKSRLHRGLVLLRRTLGVQEERFR